MAPSESICSVSDCNRRARYISTGWCNTHYNRWHRHGSTDDLTPSIEERFWAKVDRRGPDECWPWLAGKKSDGYGVFWDGAAQVGAHRISYEAHHGAIPDGLVIDHLCRNPACVNPFHLEAVDNGTNIKRGINPIAINAVLTHCRRGHPFDLINTYMTREGYRVCRTCHRLRQRRYSEQRHPEQQRDANA